VSLLDSVNDFLVRLKGGTEHLSYGRPILAGWAAGHLRALPADTVPKVLDLGCGQGDDLISFAAALDRKCELFGLEGYTPYREICATKGIETYPFNVERDRLPFADQTLDLVSMNQVLEHTKDIFFIFSEVSRVLKPGGVFLVGVPNLAAWHDRLLLMLGRQPSGMKVLGPHVRGFTPEGFQKFAECDGYFRLEGFRGSAFYPFPALASRAMARLFPGLATAVFFRLLRTDKAGTFVEILRSRRFETDYYTGPTPSAG
jgi:SAM-dependent methyltransferase